MFYKILTAVIFFWIFYAGLEFVKRKANLDKVVTRKLAHTTSAFFGVFLYLFLTRIEFMITSLCFLVFFILSYKKDFLTSVHIRYPKTFGEMFYPIALLFLAFFFYDNRFIFITSLLVLGIPDTVTGLYKYKIAKTGSITGSILYFASTLVVLVPSYIFWIGPLAIYPIFKIIFLSIVASVIEHFSPMGSDNITVPVSVSILLKALFL